MSGIVGTSHSRSKVIGRSIDTAKAWVNFNGAGGGIRDSFNVSSITDGTPLGEHVVNFGTSMANTNYCVSTANAFVAAGNGPNAHVNLHRYSASGNESAPTTSGFRITCASHAGGSADMIYVNCVIYSGA